MEDKLSLARKEINTIDKEMAALFCKRMEAVKLVAEYKKEHGLPVFDAEREASLINKNSLLISDDTLKPYYIDFLKSNMEISKKYQYKLNEGMRVAFSGVKGAFADIAAHKIFKDALRVEHSNFKEAYEAAENGECDCVLLPLENSYNGDVGQVMDLVFFGSLFINGIYDFSVCQCLLAKKGANLKDIKEVISHPQALGQCSSFIMKHGLMFTECKNTAVAAGIVAQSERNDIAAIASEEAASEFGLEILHGGINDDATNTTRFAVLSRLDKNEHNKDNEFIMFFTVKNENGSLGRALTVIGNNGFNLRSLKSRPTKDLIWSYYFYVEGEGNIYSEQGKKMLDELKSVCDNIKIVGSFEKNK